VKIALLVMCEGSKGGWGGNREKARSKSGGNGSGEEERNKHKQKRKREIELGERRSHSGNIPQPL